MQNEFFIANGMRPQTGVCSQNISLIAAVSETAAI